MIDELYDLNLVHIFYKCRAFDLFGLYTFVNIMKVCGIKN